MTAYKDEVRGTWYVSFHYYDWTSKNKRKMKRGFKTRKEALEWERNFKVKEADGIDMTFGEFFEVYTADMKPKLKLNAWRTKETIVNGKILPYFKDKKIQDIGAADIIKWQNKISSMKGPMGKKLKPTYLKTIQAELSAIFNHAVRFYSLKENPVFRAGKIGKGKADEMLFWTQEEYMKFIEKMKDKPISYYGFQILYWCGLRVGELLALTAKDIDIGNKVIHVTKSFQRIDGKDIITDPKTQKGIRDVAMPDFLVKELETYLGRLYGFYETDRIFPVVRSYYNKEMERGARLAGVKKIRVHDLRHSNVSLLISLGFPAVSIANRVGHESATITYRYAHMFPSEQTKMAEKLNQSFNNAVAEKED